MSMKIKNRKSVIEDLKKFDMAADKDDFIEVCEWPNGEGFDISITDKKIIGFTRGELEAINFLTKIQENYDSHTSNTIPKITHFYFTGETYRSEKNVLFLVQRQ